MPTMKPNSNFLLNKINSLSSSLSSSKEINLKTINNQSNKTKKNGLSLKIPQKQSLMS